MTSSANSPQPRGPGDPQTAYLQIALPLLGLYMFFVWRTPGWMLGVHGIAIALMAFALMRIAILLMWLAVMYFFRLKRDIPWNERHFVIGVVAGTPWISILGAYMLLKPREMYDFPSQGYLAWIASGIFYGILSGLWSAQTKTPRLAAIRGFLFFLIQLVVDVIFFGPQTFSSN